MTLGLIVCAAVLVAASGFGVRWRRRDGVLRHVSQPVIPGRTGSRGVQNRWTRARRRNGSSLATLTEAQLEQPLGSRATLVQFSSVYCGPCHAARRILAEVAGEVDGVRHIELDADIHLGLARELGVMTTPAVMVLDRDGTIMWRGTGRPRKADVIAAVRLTAPRDLTAPGDPAAAGAGGTAG